MTSSILLLTSLQGFLISLGLIFKPTKNRSSNIIFSLIILVVSLELLFSWGGVSGYNNSDDVIPFWLLISYLIVPPSLWLFLKLNTNPQFVIKRNHIYWFLPALLQIIIAISSWLLSKQGYYYPAHVVKRWQNIWFLFTEIIPIIWTAFVVIYYTRIILKVRTQFKDFTSPIVRMHLNKLYCLIGFFILIVTLWIPLVFFTFQVFKIIQILLVAFLFTLAYIGYFKPNFFEMPKLFIEKSSNKNLYPKYDDEKELARLKALFEIDAIYCRNKLTLNDLSFELKLPSKYISYLINTYAICNFNDFVNAHRVKAVIQRIKDPAEKHKTLVGIAMETGFNSKSAFNQIFKQHTGQVPSKYLT